MCLSAWVSYGRSYQQCLQSIRLSNKTETSITLCGKVQPPPASYGSDLKGWAIWTKVFLSQILEEGKVHPRQKFYSPNFSPGPQQILPPKRMQFHFWTKCLDCVGVCVPQMPHIVDKQPYLELNQADWEDRGLIWTLISRGWPQDNHWVGRWGPIWVSWMSKISLKWGCDTSWLSRQTHVHVSFWCAWNELPNKVGAVGHFFAPCRDLNLGPSGWQPFSQVIL